jgi:anti-sigma B factor antagonist
MPQVIVVAVALTYDFGAMVNDASITFEIIESAPDERIFKLNGALILSNIFSFQEKFRELPAANTILDITQVSYVDSAGIGCIVNAHVSCKNSGKSFLLLGPNDRVRAVLHHTRVDTVLNIAAAMPDRKTASA